MIRFGCGGNFGYNMLGKIRDEFAVLPVASQGDRGSALDLNCLGVVDGEDAVSNLVLTIKEIV